jgi:N-acetylneuraminate synthase
MKPPRIVVECGQNHQGDLVTALQMVRVIQDWCTLGFHEGDLANPIVKFQKRGIIPHRWLSEPHPNPHNSFGETYADHRRALELRLDQHTQIAGACRDYACSVWDIEAARDITGLYPHHIKIPSACNLDFEMMAKVAGAYEGEIHISLGMTTYVETEKIVSFMERMGASKRTFLYACTSGYPVKPSETALGEITRLKEVYGHRVGGFGFSGHHQGIAIDMAAVALGIDYLERHFTLDRTWKGTDHAASLEPEGLRKLMRDVVAVSEAMGTKPQSPCDPRPDERLWPHLFDVECAQREKLKHRETDRVIPPEIKAKEAV